MFAPPDNTPAIEELNWKLADDFRSLTSQQQRSPGQRLRHWRVWAYCSQNGRLGKVRANVRHRSRPGRDFIGRDMGDEKHHPRQIRREYAQVSYKMKRRHRRFRRGPLHNTPGRGQLPLVCNYDIGCQPVLITTSAEKRDVLWPCTRYKKWIPAQQHPLCGKRAPSNSSRPPVLTFI